MSRREEDKETLFMKLMSDLESDTPTYKVLDFLVVHDQFDRPMTDIARHSGVGYSTLKKMLPAWEREGIVLKREAGRAKLYRLNPDHPFVREFKVFYWRVSKSLTDELFEKEGWAREAEA
jgi:hypothetical protein